MLRFIAALFVSWLLTSIATASPTPITVWYFFQQTEKDTFLDIVDDFHKQHGETIQIKPRFIIFDAFSDKISAAIPRKRGPDLFIYPQDRLGGWVEQGLLLPIDNNLTPALTEQFYPKTLQSTYYKGNQYGLPVTFNSPAMIYNKRMMPEPPSTTQKLLSLAESTDPLEENHFTFAYRYADVYFHAMIFNAFGGEIFNQQMQPSINSQAFRRSFDVIKNWTTLGLPPTNSEASVLELFNTQQVSVVFEGPWFLRNIAANMDVGVAPLPVLSEANARLSPWATVDSILMSHQCKAPQAAFTFMSYLSGKEAQATLLNQTYIVSPNKMAYSMPGVTVKPQTQGFQEQLAYASLMPNNAEMTAFWGPATTALSRILDNKEPAESALERANAAIAQKLQAQ
tara:strand:- start:3967 stop:5157 length:1191 start_codon:yes stop_codon:yes gene_type:complete